MTNEYPDYEELAKDWLTRAEALAEKIGLRGVEGISPEESAAIRAMSDLASAHGIQVIGKELEMKRRGY